MMNSFDRQTLVSNGYRNAKAFVVGSLGIAALVFPMSAASITVPNGSFESPTPPQGFPATPQVDDWQKTDEAPGYDSANFGGLMWGQLSGVFVNSPSTEPSHISNMTGNQSAYQFTLPGVGLSTSLVSETYQPGYSYNLMFGIHGGGSIAEGDQLRLGFYYQDAGSLTPITTTLVTFTAAGFPDSSLFYDHSLDLPTVLAGDAWAGQNIGIELLSVSGFGSGTWDIDNVRLQMVPEPSTIALLAVGLGGGFLLARRRGNAEVRNNPLVKSE